MKKNIMVVDDEQGILSLMRDLLGKEGYTVHCAESGEEALAMLQELEDCHVFFLDLQMPGINGLDLCRLIKKNRPADCVYAITGYTSVFDLVECREAGFDDYIPKPFKIEQITLTAREGFEKLERWRQYRV